MSRVIVIGNSGAGKTWMARRIADALDLPYLEMDSVFHRGGWANTPSDAFLEEVDAFTSRRTWVIDGNYTSHGVADRIWPRADTIVWLDPPRWLVMKRVVSRTLSRVITREELWGGVREPWSNLYSTEPEKNIILWAWTRYRRTTERYDRMMSGSAWEHATVHRLRTKRELRRFLDRLEPAQS